MFQDLDDSLTEVLDDPAMKPAFNELFAADVSFETPDRTYTPGQTTVNLFLYEVKENRELRDNVLVQHNDATEAFRLARPPLRLDCAYVATAWSLTNGPAKIAEEHQLLGQAMQWLSRFGEVPEIHLRGSLIGAPYPALLHIAQSDPNRDAGDFWMAMGIPPRAAFYVMATIPMDLGLETEVPLVTSTFARYDHGASGPEEFVSINGFVFDAAGNPVDEARVDLAPDGTTTTTDTGGRYTFRRLRRHVQYSVTAGKPGQGQATRAFEVPSLTGDYDVRLP